MVGERYEVFATHGRGVFSSVLRAKDNLDLDPDTGKPRNVAIKMIRANETMCERRPCRQITVSQFSTRAFAFVDELRVVTMIFETPDCGGMRHGTLDPLLLCRKGE